MRTCSHSHFDLGIKTITVTLFVIALMVAATSAFAHGGATGIVKERMDFMESMGRSMKALTKMVRGVDQYEPERVRALAGEIGNHGGYALTRLFPEHSLDSPTEALPAIWTDWQQFEQLADKLQTYAAALALASANARSQSEFQIIDNQDGLVIDGRPTNAEELASMSPDISFTLLAKTCSSCHQDYRQKN